MPIYGSVAIIDYGFTDEGIDKGGHVGFVIGKTSNGAIVLHSVVTKVIQAKVALMKYHLAPKMLLAMFACRF
jgi:hypothetical protein